MKNLAIALILLLFIACKKTPTVEYQIIPYPQSITYDEGIVRLSTDLKVYCPEDLRNEAYCLMDYLTTDAAIKIELTESEAKANIALRIDSSSNIDDPEGYKIKVDKKRINISSQSREGVFYGIQTLRQILQKDENGIQVQCGTIIDYPAFAWRSFMLDEARYFHGEAFVKQMLDEMARLKMNTFHWHLTDDAGWRIEIKKYPKLTEIGSARKDTEIGTWKSGKTAGEPHSGFYTQEQIKDIVANAAARNITIVPEFEMPGHASAAIAAYTWLGTAGKEIEVPVTFGRHYDNYDVTKPEVIQFVKDVLSELFALFPSEVIHIGGDEVGYKVWEESASVQQYMKENGINTPADLQIAFTNKISKFIEQHGRRMMGWNEIMGKNIHKDFAEKNDDKEAETELAKNVVVHFWKGDIELITDAAEKGYSIVNSLHSNTYLDYSYENISLKKAYGFNPIPNDLDEKYHKNIIGLGCQMWSEWTPTNKDVERQTFPRIAAYAEVGWTTNERKDFDRFMNVLPSLLDRWDAAGILYGPVE